MLLGRSALQDGVITRAALPPGMRCIAGDVACTVDRLGSSQDSEPFVYHVLKGDGDPALLSEVDLVPVLDAVAPDPVQELTTADAGTYSLFSAREWLVRSHAQLVRNAGGFRALLSSRIDIRPHQAYVAGIVIGDWRRRYILADEVGLGKTIEAGLVIQDLLLHKPDARILVLCPGELAQQWLCEIYSKFGGHIFKLLDLHAPETVDGSSLRTAICSTTLAAIYLDRVLGSVSWDMVVVDEVHHLLHDPRLYSLVERLSRAASSVLLLSALPAQRREDEFLQLLRLLEPERYSAGSTAGPEFRALYEVQRDVGRRIRRLSGRIEELRAGEILPESLIRVAARLPETPGLDQDSDLRRLVDGLQERTDDLVDAAQEVVSYVADQYRINRRILRNRRQSLIERGELVAIERRLHSLPYDPGQLEIEVGNSVLSLLRHAREAGLAAEVLDAAARLLLQALASPTAAHDVLYRIQALPPSRLGELESAYVASGTLAAYDEWPAYRDALCKAVRPFLDVGLLTEAVARAHAWRESARGEVRRDRLISRVLEIVASRPLSKVLVFAGFPGICHEVAAALSAALDQGAVREFRHGLARAEKEANALAFSSDPGVSALVSDETGGEGRNFQFVDEIIHYDTPWNTARVEQRIGRADRIGRESVRTDATSEVVFAEGSPEAGLIHCLAHGVGVYTSSISGLEFALRETEHDILSAALDGGYDAMVERAPMLRERLEQERATDDEQSLVDEASFNRTTAARLQRVRHSRKVDEDVEHSFVRYLQAVASRRAARPEDDRRHAKGVWTLDPEEFRRGVLPRAGAAQEAVFRKSRGTFQRSIAKDRLDLDFFTAGHPLFDAVVRSLTDVGTGRSYAVSCLAQEHKPWIGFEFVFRVEPGLDAIAGSLGLANRAEMIFTSNPLHLFLDCEGTVEEDGHALRQVRSGLRMPDRGVKWADLSGARLRNQFRLRLGDSWQRSLLRIAGTAAECARTHFSERLRPVLDEELARIAESIRQIESTSGLQDQDAIMQLERLGAAISGWTVECDAAGFLQVNAHGA